MPTFFRLLEAVTFRLSVLPLTLALGCSSTPPVSPQSPVIDVPSTGCGKVVEFCGKSIGIDATEVVCRDPDIDDLTPLRCLRKLTSLDLATRAQPIPWTGWTHERTYGYRTNVEDLTPLRSLSHLKYLRLNGSEVTDLSPLTELTALERLGLANTPIYDLSPLEQLRRLRDLDISYTSVRNLAPFSQLSELRTLRLADTTIDDLIPLANLTNLEKLDLDHVRTGSLEPIAKLSNLRVLLVRHQKLAKALAGLTRIETLHCEYAKVDDPAVISKLTALTDLNVAYSYFELPDLRPLTKLQKLTISRLDEFLAVLAGLTELTNLEIFNMGQPIKDLSWLAKLTKLRSLRFGIAGVQTSDLSPLRNLTKLERLGLNMRDYDQVAVDTLSTLTSIRELSGINVKVLKDLRRLSRLEQLGVFLTRETPDGLNALWHFPRLTQLHVSSANYGRSYEVLSKLTNLEELTLHHFMNEGPEYPVDARYVAQLPKLKKLYAMGARLNHVEALAKIQSLTELDLEGPISKPIGLPPNLTKCSTNSLVKATVRAYPHLREVNMPIAEGTLQVLAATPKLRTLMLRASSAQEAQIDLTKVLAPTRLRLLELRNVRAAAMKELVRFRHLRSLTLSGKSVSDLTPLSGLSYLRQLTIDRTQVRSLAPARRWKRLRSISFCRTPVSDITPLRDLPTLVHLDGAGSEVPAQELETAAQK